MGRTKRFRMVIALFGLATISGSCASGRSGPEISAMHSRFTRVMAIHTGIVLGDIERAQDAADWLTRQEDNRVFPPEAERYKAEMKRFASLIARDRDLETMATRAGQLAATCGSCHRAMTGGPTFVVGSQAGSGESTANHMILHVWAVDRMWEGLVGPSQEAWEAGSLALTREWVPTEAAAQRSGSPQAARAILGELAQLGSLAKEASTQEARAALYGDVLKSCSRCHGGGALP